MNQRLGPPVMGGNPLHAVRVVEKDRGEAAMRGTFAWLGSALVGIGVGLLFDKLLIGVLIGVGIGFIFWDPLGGKSFWNKYGG